MHVSARILTGALRRCRPRPGGERFAIFFTSGLFAEMHESWGRPSSASASATRNCQRTTRHDIYRERLVSRVASAIYCVCVPTNAPTIVARGGRQSRARPMERRDVAVSATFERLPCVPKNKFYRKI